MFSHQSFGVFVLIMIRAMMVMMSLKMDEMAVRRLSVFGRPSWSKNWTSSLWQCATKMRMKKP